jgi:hypothetical protein
MADQTAVLWFDEDGSPNTLVFKGNPKLGEQWIRGYERGQVDPRLGKTAYVDMNLGWSSLAGHGHPSVGRVSHLVSTPQYSIISRGIRHEHVGSD